MKESKFTGGMLGYLGVRIVAFLITSFTLGIGYPWAVTYKQKWLTKHQTIDGEQLVFTGTGGQLFGNYIKWFLLSIITLGIYALWLPIKIQQWVTKNTHQLSTLTNVEITESKRSQQESSNTSQKSLSFKNKKLQKLLIFVTSIVVFSLAYYLIDIVIIASKYNIEFRVLFIRSNGLLRVIMFVITMIGLLIQLFGKNRPVIMVFVSICILVDIILIQRGFSNMAPFVISPMWINIIAFLFIKIIAFALVIPATIISFKQKGLKD